MSPFVSPYEDPSPPTGWERVCIPCWLCDGEGEDPDQPERACPVCGGEGETL